MPQVVFKGAEYPDSNITCDVVIVGDQASVYQAASDHIKMDHDFDPDSQLINQTIREYNESEDGPPDNCSYAPE